MKAGLLWRLCWIVAAGTVLVFYSINYLANHAEWKLSIIAEEHQQLLRDYGEKAEQIHLSGDDLALTAWLDEIRKKEDTWVAVVNTELTTYGGSYLSEQFKQGFGLGRAIYWKIHLYFSYNPIMEIPFADDRTFFLIKLPDYMRPGGFLTITQVFLQIALPFLVLAGLALVLYRHIMTPLQHLEKATRQFSEGNYEVRLSESFGSRKDELSALADTFDHMAEKTGSLIVTQRQLIGDLSHELRAPLSRIDMALDSIEQGLPQQQALDRLRSDSAQMRELVEDALTLAWLSTESPKLDKDDFDLVELIKVICDDAHFEYPDRELIIETPPEAPMVKSSQRAVGQAIENVVRNALKHTPLGNEVKVSLALTGGVYLIAIKDQGCGVPDALLDDIFKPFFQVDESRTQQSGLIDGATKVKTSDLASESVKSKKQGGFGLGLALAQRQILAVGGAIHAENYQQQVQPVSDSPSTQNQIQSGLKVIIKLPIPAT